jgi:hypothetical protein
MDENERFALLQMFFNALIDLRPEEDLYLPYSGKEFAEVALRLSGSNKFAFGFFTPVGPEREYAAGIAHLRELGFIKLIFEARPCLVPEYSHIAAARFEGDPRVSAIREFAQAYLKAIAPSPS